jgi:two-component system, LytTR family, sensor kinase
MKEFISKQENVHRVEFWAATALFVFILFFYISHTAGIDNPAAMTPGEVKTPFDLAFLSQLVRYVVVYGTFLFLDLTIVPRLMRKESTVLNVLIILSLLLIVGLVFGITDTYIKAYLLSHFGTLEDAYIYIFQKSFLYAAWLLFIFGFYTLIKYAGLYLLAHVTGIQSRYRFVTPFLLLAIILWLIGLLLLVAGEANQVIVALWTILVSSSIFIYTYSYHFLIPSSLKKKHPYRTYTWKIILVLLISMLPAGLLAMLITNNSDASAGITSFNAAIQLFVVVPVSWIVFMRTMKGREELFVLKKELDQSHASFDFLRSQINPHFLFNALNTIYGTAIQEKAERTSEGIEKLGDMMRFMLQENVQEKIALSREIDYLNNYISLQKLRTDPNPAIQIEAVVEQPVQTVQIAPMLLIPFVENAFKHGISFREPSHIRISLELRDRTLYFDVYNSKHLRPDNDPEKDRSGIGLNNVKQRLKLLYPKKHELVIRETAKDFFVHLTITLS